MMHRKIAHVRVRIIGDELALDHVRIVHDLRHIVYRTDGNLRLFEEPHVLCLRALRDERPDDRVELRRMANPIRIRAIAWIVDEIRTSDRTEYALGHLLRRRGKTHVTPVLA
jgi:hypothetical protein